MQISHTWHHQIVTCVSSSVDTYCKSNRCQKRYCTERLTDPDVDAGGRWLSLIAVVKGEGVTADPLCPRSISDTRFRPPSFSEGDTLGIPQGYPAVPIRNDSVAHAIILPIPPQRDRLKTLRPFGLQRCQGCALPILWFTEGVPRKYSRYHC